MFNEEQIACALEQAEAGVPVSATLRRRIARRRGVDLEILAGRRARCGARVFPTVERRVRAGVDPRTGDRARPQIAAVERRARAARLGRTTDDATPTGRALERRVTARVLARALNPAGVATAGRARRRARRPGRTGSEANARAAPGSSDSRRSCSAPTRTGVAALTTGGRPCVHEPARTPAIEGLRSAVRRRPAGCGRSACLRSTHAGCPASASCRRPAGLGRPSRRGRATRIGCARRWSTAFEECSFVVAAAREHDERERSNDHMAQDATIVPRATRRLSVRGESGAPVASTPQPSSPTTRPLGSYS